MKRTITIAPILRKEGTTQILHGKYYNKKAKQTINILTNGSVIFGECQPGDKTKNITISDHNPHFTFSWDDDDDAQGMLEAHAWSKNTTVESPGNDNLVRAMFRLVDQTEKASIDVKMLKYKGRVYSIINNMSTKEMRNIAFFVGENPIHQSPDEIFINLVDFENGKLMKDPDKFIDTVTTPDMNYIVIAKKAILYDVISKKDGQYYIGMELIGSSFADVLAYCKSNKQQFEGYIKKEVEKLDVLPLNIDYDKPVKDIIGMVKKIGKKEASIEVDVEKAAKISNAEAEKEKDVKLNELRKVAKGLNVKSWHLMGEGKLIKAIGDVKKEKEYPQIAEERV